MQTAPCNEQPCPTLRDCQGKWGPFSKCSAKCEGGTKKRRWHVIEVKANSHIPPPTLTPPDPFWALEAFYSDDSFYPHVFYSRLEVVNVQNYGLILSFIVRSRASPPPDLSLGIYRH